FVAEADESDGSFLRLSPFCAVVTNIEDDHLEFYGDMEREKDAFVSFLKGVKKDGFGVACGDHPNVVDILGKNRLPRVFTYGIENEQVDFWGKIVKARKDGFVFEVSRKGIRIGDFCLNLPGLHNVENALACIAVGVELGIPVNDMQETLSSFRGVKRRFEKVGMFRGVLVVDDYAHHPTEMKVVVNAALHFTSGRVVVVFQPHRYTRTKRLYREMAEALQEAHQVILLPIYSANEEPIPGVSTELVYREMLRRGFEKVRFARDFEEAVTECQKVSQTGDIIVTMGAGDVWRVGTMLCGKDGKA
ncbi:MAG: UDP-N-acetylmuramate--L-alanine ligase, partial [Candidatus Caldatribacteriaceae bacterium]